jgi:arylsulfatase A-like enzyme
MVMNLDFAPTFADLVGGGVPGDMQGQSLRPLLEGRSFGQWRQEVYYHYYKQFDIPGQFGIRTPTHKLVCYPGLAAQQPFWELFDLQTDPQEMRNLAAAPAQRATVAALKERLRALANRYQDAEVVKSLDQLGHPQTK